MKILLAEDEKALSKALVKILERSNYSVDAVFDGEEALNFAENGEYDAIILDIMMPKMDGITVLKSIRARGIGIPVLMLTARSEIMDKVLGLDSGADDYLTKPFDTRELLARIRCMTRGRGETDVKLRMGNISLDRSTYELSTETGRCRLVNKEFQMMELLLLNQHQIFSTERLMCKIWGYESDAEINVVWVNISALRKKLAELGANIHIRVSRGAGYSLENNDD